MIRWGFNDESRAEIKATMEQTCRNMTGVPDPTGITTASVVLIEKLLAVDEVETAWLVNSVLVFRTNEVHGDLMPLVNQIAKAHGISE